MVKLEVIENFTLKAFDELQNLERRRGGTLGQLNVGDTFECSEDMAKYLMGQNSLGKTVVKVIEVNPKEQPKEEPKVEEVVEEHIEEKPKKKKGKK